MYCYNCGKELHPEAVVCPNCGVWTGEEKSMSFTQENTGNGMAVAGFACSFFVPILGFIFGCIGLSKAKKQGGIVNNFANILALCGGGVEFVVLLKQRECSRCSKLKCG